jgi:hypothetical protein
LTKRVAYYVARENYEIRGHLLANLRTSISKTWDK